MENDAAATGSQEIHVLDRDVDHIKVFASADAPDEWFEENELWGRGVRIWGDGVSRF
jgi:hypothetical protein